MARPQSNGIGTKIDILQIQAQLDVSARTRPPKPTSPYNHVDVLLLQWDEDDLTVDSEVKELQHVFVTRCNFATHRWGIPSIESEDSLLNRILEFKMGKTDSDLLILYYGGSPKLNWHNVQYALLGSPAHVLLIFDCCFAPLAARNGGTGANWFLGASAKESVATGVSRESFTSTLTREIDRCAHLYRTRNTKFTVQSIHHALTFDRDLAHTPNLLRLTDYECDPTELTPLLYPQRSTQTLPRSSTEPVDQKTLPSSPPPTSYTNNYTTPIHNNQEHIPEPNPFSAWEHGPTAVELSPDETHTLRVRGLPLSTDKHDLVRWFENRLARATVITKIGPLTESPARRESMEATVTFSSVTLAMQALRIGNLDFQAKGGTYPRNVAIDKDFTGLTCLYSSIKSPNRQPSIDIVLVHGAYGHALNSFASHYKEPAGEFVWPCEALARSLEKAGVYPRIMTFGWDANAWLEPTEGRPQSCNELLAALQERNTSNQMPLFFISHGVGGFLVKEAVSEIINNGFNFQHFENPVKACFFFAVPNRSDGIDGGFPRLLANMCSALRNGGSPGFQLVRAFRGRNAAVSSLTQEFEAIRQEHGVKCLTFSGTQRTFGCMIVPPKQSTLDDNKDSAFHFALDYRDVMRLPMGGEPLNKVTDTLDEAICNKLRVSSPPDIALGSLQLGGEQSPFVSRLSGKQKEKEKERVFRKLRSYDTVFLVDDSASMYGRRWDTTKHVLATIASIAVQHDKDGVDVRFFNKHLEDDERLHRDSADKVMDVFSKVEPHGSTPTADVLERELQDYIHEYRSDRHRKGLNLIILTDGEPDNDQDVAAVIVKIAKVLEQLEAPLRQVGIQFVQIGGDKEAADFLAMLDSDLKERYGLDRDMVDTVPWVADDEERLYEEILLGGILSRYDDDEVVEGRSRAIAEGHPSRLASHHALDGAYRANRQVNTAVDIFEPGGDEDSDSLSDLSEASSFQSLPSLVSDSSAASIRDKYESKGTEHLAAILSEDPALTSMYEAATTKLGRERFLKNHDQLLKAFFKDLRSETQNAVQLATVRGLRKRDRRHKITLLIRNKYGPLNVNKQQAMNILRDQKPNRTQLLNDYLRGSTPILRNDLLAALDNNLEPDDGLVDEEASSNSSDDSNIQPLDQGNKEKYPYLEPLENFITKGCAFARFKTNFGYLLQPPTNLSEALKSHDLRVVQRFLTKNFESAASSDFDWLHELDEAEYSVREIAELLLEDISDSPWIHFTPQVHMKFPIRINFHVPDCAHQISLNTRPPSILHSEQFPSCSTPLQSDVHRLVEELCGLGGVAPSSRDVSTWHGRVTFEEQCSVSVITYATGSAVTRRSRNDLVVKISNVLMNFLDAAAAVQSNGLCCDSFTFLLRKQNCLELRRVEFCHALTMSSNINLALQDNDTETVVQQCVQEAEYILRELEMPIADMTPNADLHYCALAAQFLCSAFLSYVQAHVGSLDPFFLDKPQRKMVLLGSQLMPGDIAINAELVELTCLAEMTQQPVLAFSLLATSQERGLESGTSRYDVLTSAENCLDTWGPGYFVYDKAHPSEIYAVALGSGFVSLVDSKTSRFHWAKGQLSESASRAAFEKHTIMRIGTGVNINENCCIDEAVCRESSFSALEPLGTHEISWEIQERQAGLQGGQYLIGTYSQTWNKVPGTTLKQTILQRPDWYLIYFLEHNWGLQVSFCTSIARRVSLRELVTDLFPIFVNPLEQETWQELVNSHKIIQAFTQGDLFPWLRSISPLLRDYVLTLVRTILEQLQHTGLDRQKANLVVAWPREGDIGRGVKIPCRAETYWAQVVADAEDCATFAYVTSRCLETGQIKCQGTMRVWQNASKMLVTEMSPSILEEQSLVITNAAITTSNVNPVTTTATATTQWELENKRIYYIKKLDSLLRVRAERPCSTSNDVTHLVVATSNIPQEWWKRLRLKGKERRNHRIRERQAIGDHAELVVIRAGLIGP